MKSRIIPIIKKEIIESRKDPYFLALAVILPLFLLFTFGYSFTLDVINVPTAVYDRDRTPASRDYISHFVDSSYFTLRYYLQDEKDINRLLDHGSVRVVLIIPENFSNRLAKKLKPQVQTLIDGSYPVTGRAIVNYIKAINATYSAKNPSYRNPPVEAESRVWFNPTLEMKNYVVSGLFVVILLAFPPLLTTLAVVREKENGSIQQIFVSPIKSYEYILGKMIPYVAITFLDLFMIIFFALYWFDLPLRGSFLLLLFTSAIYIFCTVGLGLLISTVTKSQLAAMLLVMAGAMLPSLYFSGFFFPVDKIPFLLQINAYLFPGKYFNDIARGIFLKGSGINDLFPNIICLSVYTALIFFLAWLNFKKKLS